MARNDGPLRPDEFIHWMGGQLEDDLDDRMPGASDVVWAEGTFVHRGRAFRVFAVRDSKDLPQALQDAVADEAERDNAARGRLEEKERLLEERLARMEAALLETSRLASNLSKKLHEMDGSIRSHEGQIGDLAAAMDGGA